jgi:hypothetical protein
MSRLSVRREQVLARARNARGRRGEQQAEALLTAAGYAIVARQQRTTYALRSGDDELRVGLSFDFVVEKDGVQCVAEVKTGALGTQLKHADTRRQLLEYQLASGCSSVLLVDPERARISRVAFPLAQPAPEVSVEPTHSAGSWTLWLCVAMGCALGIYLFAH